MDDSGSAVYTLNCLSSIHALLSLYEYTDTRLEMIQAQIEAHEDVLVSEQAGFVLNRIGMLTAYNSAQKHQSNQGPMSNIPGLDGETLSAVFGRFDLFLASPDSYRLPQSNLLTSTKIRDKIQKRTVAVLCDAYETLETKVKDPLNNYNNPNVIVPKETQQIRELLG